MKYANYAAGVAAKPAPLTMLGGWQHFLASYLRPAAGRLAELCAPLSRL